MAGIKNRGTIQSDIFAGRNPGSSGTDSATIKDKTEKAVIDFINFAFMTASTVNLTNKFEEIDKYYQMEDERDGQNEIIRKLNALGDKKKLSNARIPLVATQVETATSYLQETFLTGYPIFGIAANKTYAEEAKMLEAVFKENQATANWTTNLLKCYRDGMKYNLMHAKVFWDTTDVPQVSNNISSLSAPGTAIKSTRLWAGNKIQHLDVYNTHIDRRVDPASAHIDGEFAYHNEIITRITLIKYINKLKAERVRLRDPDAALRMQANVNNATKYNVPIINKGVAPTGYMSNTGAVNWMSWLTGEAANQQYAATYTRTMLYARIIPFEFGIYATSPHTPQIWEFCIINGAHVLFARPLSNYHDYLPIITGVPHDDALRYQTKSLAGNAQGFQDQAQALWNIHLESQRRNLSDRTLYDPSMVDPAQMNNPNPSAKIPIKANALGRALNQAVFPFPFRDNTGNLPQEAQAIVGFANMMNGQNQASQGQFVKGNKTMEEYNDVMSNSTFRNRMFALSIENGFHAAMKQILLVNTLQYQDTASFIQASGLTDSGKPITYNPVDVRNANLAFKLSDGAQPKSKILSTDQMSNAMTAISTSPQIGQEYSTGDIFAYLLDMQGADISQFKKDPATVTYENAMNSWQQTVLQLAKQNPDIDPKKFPPQPKPTDYGLGPDGKPVDPNAQPSATQQAVTKSMGSVG